MVATRKYAGSMPPAYGLWLWRRDFIRATYPASRGMTTSPLDVYHHVEQSGARYTSPADNPHVALCFVRATYMSPLCIVLTCRTVRGEVHLARKNPAPASHCVLFFCPSAFSIALRLCVVVLQPPSTNRRATHTSPLRKLFHATVTQRILYRYACSDWNSP